jgi:tRNA pseudouridine55 synthase
MARRNSRKHRLPPFEHSGILLVDKPKEWTSHDVVNLVKCRFNVKVGHCGT